MTPSTLVLGMGVGTFITIFFAVILLFIFCLSGPCDAERKIVWRSTSVVVFLAIFLGLLYAPREAMYAASEPQTEVSVFLSFFLHVLSLICHFPIVRSMTIQSARALPSR
jgi:4-amino-4-deoxy-L-arabinose transferase-like glycosyltransferase